MPTYCYKIKEGQNVNVRLPSPIPKTVEMVFPIGSAPEVIDVMSEGSCECGIFKPFVFERDRAAEMASISVPATKGWPIECLASGVNADQSGELRDHFKKKGLDVAVTKDGNPVYRSASHRKKALKARGLVDKAAYV